MDISKMYNPFDFANPVNDPKLFAGRRKELDEIEYYLNHAKAAPRAINLALIGDRASGKTSLLNMIDVGAKQRGFLIVREDLDESDIETQLVFFLKLFDGIFTAACKDGAFGGLQGKTYDIYRSMVDAYDIPSDRTFCPFIFPMQYAKAMSKGNVSTPVSDHGFKDDIILVQEQVAKPVAILFDECDVLGKSRVHLEKLRNIFMNLSGFFIVFTGTGTFFPLINDVFSPIIRQFKKINVMPFEDEKDTKDCVEKPLKLLGIRTKEIFDSETYSEIDSIHNLSGGRPYEIQLICHYMFKRMQQGRATKIQLSVDVLDDVLLDLQSLHDVTVRPIVQTIRGLSMEELSALNKLVMSSSLITFEQAWFTEYVFSGSKKWEKETLKSQLDTLIQKNLIKVENDYLNFTGDDFDRIYCKYYSNKLQVYEKFNDIPFRIRMRFEIEHRIRRKLPCIQMEQHDSGDYSETDFMNIVDKFTSKDFSFFISNPKLAEVFYRANLTNQKYESFPFIYLNLKTPWEDLHAWYTVEGKDKDCIGSKCLSDFNRIFKGIKARVSKVNGELIINVYTIPVVGIDFLVESIIKVDNQNLLSRLATLHISEMYESYTDLRNVEDAKYHAELAYKFEPKPHEIEAANNLGYLFLSIGDIEKARNLFETAKEETNSSFEDLPIYSQEDFDSRWNTMVALANYNLATVYAMQNDFSKAVEYFNISIEKSTGQKDNRCACLFIPIIQENNLKFSEVFEPNLLDIAMSSLKTIKEYMQKLVQ